MDGHGVCLRHVHGGGDVGPNLLVCTAQPGRNIMIQMTELSFKTYLYLLSFFSSTSLWQLLARAMAHCCQSTLDTLRETCWVQAL